jgi:hypothetical protein
MLSGESIMSTHHLVVAIGLAALSASASAITCSGPVKGVSIEPTNGDVLAESIGGLSWPRLCSVRATANGIAPESCRSTYAALLAAQAGGRTVTLWFNNPAITSCGAFSSWQFTEGFYFLRVDN